MSIHAQRRQTKQRFANSEEYLSYELGKAVQELPPFYTRFLAGSITIMVLSAIAWAYYSEVEEVATGVGQLIPSAEVRPVRSLDSGTIKSIKIKEGQKVKEGEILVEKDPDLKTGEVERLENSKKLIQEDIARLEAEKLGKTNTGIAAQDQLLNSRLKEFMERRAIAISEANRKVAEINEAKVRLTRLKDNLENAQSNLANAQNSLANIKTLLPKAQENLKLAEEKEQSLKTLVESGGFPRLDYLNAQEAVIRAKTDITRTQEEINKAEDKIVEYRDRVGSLQKDMDGQIQQIKQAQEAYKGAVNTANRLTSDRQTEILTQLNKRQEELTAIEGQFQQAKKQRQGATIKAPVSGTVYNIKATQGTVQPGEELLSIVPDNQELLLEVKVLNRDIGFVNQAIAKQKTVKAKVKLATFPFQEFGTIDAEVIKVSPNAILEKDLGLVFVTRIKLKKHSLKIRNQEVEFTPGMAASAEIVTRKKSILTFLIEPITRRFDEAFSVR